MPLKNAVRIVFQSKKTIISAQLFILLWILLEYVSINVSAFLPFCLNQDAESIIVTAFICTSMVFQSRTWLVDELSHSKSLRPKSFKFFPYFLLRVTLGMLLDSCATCSSEKKGNCSPPPVVMVN